MAGAKNMKATGEFMTTVRRNGTNDNDENTGKSNGAHAREQVAKSLVPALANNRGSRNSR